MYEATCHVFPRLLAHELGNGNGEDDPWHCLLKVSLTNAVTGPMRVITDDIAL